MRIYKKDPPLFQNKEGKLWKTILEKCKKKKKEKEKSTGTAKLNNEIEVPMYYGRVLYKTTTYT